MGCSFVVVLLGWSWSEYFGLVVGCLGIEVVVRAGDLCLVLVSDVPGAVVDAIEPFPAPPLKDGCDRETNAVLPASTTDE